MAEGEAIALRLEAIATRVEAIAPRVEAISIRFLKVFFLKFFFSSGRGGGNRSEVGGHRY